MGTEKDQWRSGEEESDSDMSRDISEDDFMPNEKSTAMFDKDSDEEELELLVLGNKTGFRENLAKHGGIFGHEDADMEESADDEDVAGLEAMDDADLFMIDTGAPGAAAAAAKSAVAPNMMKKGDTPLWEDSDDERLAISLASATRLRKLRKTEAEDFVSGTEYCRRLRQQYLLLNPAPAWVTRSEARPAKRRRRSSASSASSSDDDDNTSATPLEQFLRDVNRLAGAGASGKRLLRPEVIDIQRTREIPDAHEGPVWRLSFHPEYPVLLSSSAAGMMYLHHISPDAQPANPRLTSVMAKGVDVRMSQFLYPRGDKIFFAGRRKYFHQWDLPSGVVQKVSQIQGQAKAHKSMERFRLSPCGRYMAIQASSRKGGGELNVLSVATMQWICNARLQGNNGIADFAWWSTGDGITILGRGGSVGEYSMERRAFLGIWQDDGSVGAIVVALGGHHGPAALGDDRWVAVGSNTGITNIYDRNELLDASKQTDVTIKERPTPKRAFEQLITPITSLAFSPDGQILAFASDKKKGALRLAHLPSCAVYRNWPTQQTPLGTVSAVAFSRDSSLLAVGNYVGKIKLWNIRS